MNPIPTEPSGAKSSFSTIQAIVCRQSWAQFLLQHKVSALATAGVLSVAALWPSDPPSNDEIWAYRVGFGMGQACRVHGGPDDPEEVARGMDGMRGHEYDMFESGFTDGRKGRSAKYEVPESFERYSQPDVGYTADRNRLLDEMYRLRFGDEEDDAEDAVPQPTEEESSPTGDYIMNSIYGTAPSKPSPTEENPR